MYETSSLLLTVCVMCLLYSMQNYFLLLCVFLLKLLQKYFKPLFCMCKGDVGNINYNQ